jgi:hypothetical protein
MSVQPFIHISNNYRIKTNRKEHYKKHTTKNELNTNLIEKLLPQKKTYMKTQNTKKPNGPYLHIVEKK